MGNVIEGVFSKVLGTSQSSTSPQCGPDPSSAPWWDDARKQWMVPQPLSTIPIPHISSPQTPIAPAQGSWQQLQNASPQQIGNPAQDQFAIALRGVIRELQGEVV